MVALSSLLKFVAGALIALNLSEKIDALPRCPSKCRCTVDLHGRRTVTCMQGSMRDPIPVFDMDGDTKILHITAPQNRKNYLSLGPIFQRLRRLEDIHITYSGVPNMGEHSFWGLHNLKNLNLTWNHLTSLRDTNFKGATSLKTLDLSHNRIESVPSAAFRHIRQLKFLSLAYNFIPELVPRIFYGLSQLESLDLSFNPLQELYPDIFTDVSSLRSLKCSGCNLSIFRASILNALPLLEELYLDNNKLMRLPDNIANSKYLKTLQLNENHITLVERHAFLNSRLDELHLGHNKIVRVETDSFLNSSLSHIDLKYNSISDFSPDSLRGIHDQLRVLKLSGNSLNFRALVKILHTTQGLEELGIGDVGLTSLKPELLRYCKSIRNLNLSRNYLTTIPLELFATCPNLRILDLSMNSFRGLKTDVLEVISRVKTLEMLRLEGNPWLCDQCHVIPLLQWLQGAPDQKSGCQEPKVWTCLKCVGPPRLAGLELSLLPPGDLPECPKHPSLKIDIENLSPTHPVLSLSDQPKFPDSDGYQISSSEQEIIKIRPSKNLLSFFKDKLQNVLIAGGIIVTSLLFIVLISVVSYYKHRAHYYTNEQTPAAASQTINNNNKSPRKSSGKKATIASIDEIRNIAGSTECVNSAAFQGKGKKKSKQKRETETKEDGNGIQQTVVDEMGRTRLCKSSDLLIEILESEPRPGKG